jgi:hypothetical protein
LKGVEASRLEARLLLFAVNLPNGVPLASRSAGVINFEVMGMASEFGMQREEGRESSVFV